MNLLQTSDEFPPAPDAPLDLALVAQSVEFAVNAFIAAGTSSRIANSRRGPLTYVIGWLQLRCGMTLHDGPLPVWVAAQFAHDHLAQRLPDGLVLSRLPEEVDRQLVAARIKLKKGHLAHQTILARLKLIGQWHRLQGWPDPTLDEAVRSLLRQGLLTPARMRRSALPSCHPLPSRRHLLASCGGDVHGVRDRALLLLAWDENGRFQRAVADLQVRDARALCAGRGHGKLWGTIPGDTAIQALRAWMVEAPATDGPLFRRLFKCGKVSTVGLSVNQVLRIAQRHGRLAGADGRWSGMQLASSATVTAVRGQRFR